MAVWVASVALVAAQYLDGHVHKMQPPRVAFVDAMGASYRPPMALQH
jgi:hypothetical protein